MLRRRTILRMGQLESRWCPSNVCPEWFEDTEQANELALSAEWVAGDDGSLSLVSGDCGLTIWQQLPQEEESQILDLAGSFLVTLPDLPPEIDSCGDDNLPCGCDDDDLQETNEGCQPPPTVDMMITLLNEVLASTEQRRIEASRALTRARNRLREIVTSVNPDPSQVADAAIGLRSALHGYVTVDRDYTRLLDLTQVPREELVAALRASYRLKRNEVDLSKQGADQALADLRQAIQGPSMAPRLVAAAGTAAWTAEAYRQDIIALEDLYYILNGERPEEN